MKKLIVIILIIGVSCMAIKNIYQNQIIGNVQNELIVDNKINKVESSENTTALISTHTTTTLPNNLYPESQDVFWSSSLIITNQPSSYAKYNGYIYTDSLSKDWIICIEDYKYDGKYTHIAHDQEPFFAVRYNDGQITSAEADNRDTISDFENNLNSAYNSFNLALIGLPNYVNADGSTAHIAFAIKITDASTSSAYFMYGGSADLQYLDVSINSIIYGTGKNIYSLKSNELIQSNTEFTSDLPPEIILTKHSNANSVYITIDEPYVFDIYIKIWYALLNETVKIKAGSTRSNTIKTILFYTFNIDLSYYKAPISTYLSNNIISNYENGKQILSFPVKLNNINDRYLVGDKVNVFGFDGNTIARKKDGQPKNFLITSAEFNYDGMVKQKLKMVETFV